MLPPLEFEVGDCVRCSVTKHKEKYNNQTAQITAVLAQHLKLIMLSGPEKDCAWKTVKVNCTIVQKRVDPTEDAAKAAAEEEGPKAAPTPTDACAPVPELSTSEVAAALFPGLQLGGSPSPAGMEID